MPTNIGGAVVNDEDYVGNAELQNALTGASKQLMQRTTAALTPAAVAANTTAEQTFNVNTPNGATDLVFAQKPAAQAGLGVVGCRRVSGTQIAITFCNDTAGALTPTAAESYNLYWLGFNA